MKRLKVAAMAIVSLATVGATTNHSRYDPIGRLTATCQYDVTNGKRTEYSFDRASNRAKLRSFSTPVTIPAGTGVDSPNGLFHLVMQHDGNLVLYEGPSGVPWTPRWGSNTLNSGGMTAYLQSDGNMVIRRTDGTAVWGSGTYGSWCAALYVQSDGKAVIYDLDGAPVWATS